MFRNIFIIVLLQKIAKLLNISKIVVTTSNYNIYYLKLLNNKHGKSVKCLGPVSSSRFVVEKTECTSILLKGQDQPDMVIDAGLTGTILVFILLHDHTNLQVLAVLPSVSLQDNLLQTLSWTGRASCSTPLSVPVFCGSSCT